MYTWEVHQEEGVNSGFRGRTERFADKIKKQMIKK